MKAKKSSIYILPMSTFLLLKSVTSNIGRRIYTGTNHFHSHLPTFAFTKSSFLNNGRLIQPSSIVSTIHTKPFKSAKHTSALFSSKSTQYTSKQLNATSSPHTSLLSKSNSTFNDKKTFVAATVAATSAAVLATVSSCEDGTMPFPENAIQADTYNGITIQISRLPPELIHSPDMFEKALIKALHLWKNEGKRGIWIKLPKEYSTLIPPCIEQGFDFQNAEKGRIILTKWLPTDCESRLPLGPSHQVGIGAILIHPTKPNQILVVQEKSGPAAKYQLWKMPTGLSDPNEDISDAAVREMYEETGLKCIFDQILCFRQAHNVGAFGKSDLFFICLMRLDPVEYNFMDADNVDECLNQWIKPQEEEIAKIDWMDINEFSNQSLWVNSPLYSEMHTAIMRVVTDAKQNMKSDDDVAIDVNGDVDKNKSYTDNHGFIAKKLPLGYRDGSNTVYLSKL